MKTRLIPSISVILALLALSQRSHAEIEVFGSSPPTFSIVEATASDPAFGQALATVNPWGIECHPDTGHIYFSDPTAGFIGYFDPLDKIPTVTPVISRPGSVFHGIHLDAPRNRLFFLDSANDSVNVVDLGTLVETVIVAGYEITRPNDLVYDPERNRIVFTDSGYDFLGFIFDVGSGQSLGGAINDMTKGAWGIAVHPDTGEIFFSSHDRGEISIVDPRSMATTVVASGLDAPRGLHFDRYGRLFCQLSGGDQVAQIELPSGAVRNPVFSGSVNGRAFTLYEGADKDGDFLLDAWERRHVPTVFDLAADDDPDMDDNSALHELLYNGTPGGGDPSPVRGLDPQGGGLVTVVFEGPTSGYLFDIELTSDFVTWTASPEQLIADPHADPLFSSWRSTIDIAALGLNPNVIAVRLRGEPAGP